MSEGQRYHARADNPLSNVAAAGKEGDRVEMERSCPDESTAMSGEIDAELRAADACRQAHQPSWNHRQQEGGTGVLGGRTKGTEDTRSDNHAGSHERSRSASKRARRR